MQININGAQMYQELNEAYNICKAHPQCIGCDCAEGKPFQIGNSIIVCENFERYKYKQDT